MLWPSGVVDVEAAAAVVVVGLPEPTVCRIGAVLKARRLDASEDGIERLLVDGEGVVVGSKRSIVAKTRNGRTRPGPCVWLSFHPHRRARATKGCSTLFILRSSFMGNSR